MPRASELAWKEASAEEQARIRRQNNPEGKPTGDFTGRCSRCGSTDLWDDNLYYGCNHCGHVPGSQFR